MTPHTHGIALLLVLWLPLGAVLARRVLPGRLRRRLTRLAAADRVALQLMAVTGAVHLGLVFDHAHDPVTATLFVLFALSMAAMVAAALARVPGWREVSSLLLAGALGAYAAYVLGGLETPDLLGVATKGVEALALGVLLRASRASRGGPALFRTAHRRGPASGPS